MTSSLFNRTLAAAAVVGLAASGSLAQSVEPELFTLDNGMQFILLPRDDQPLNVSAGWVAKVGSVNERPGITGVSHFLEHMLFKGSDRIGTSDAAADAEFGRQITEARHKIFDMIYKVQYPRYRRGEIDFPWNPANDTAELKALRGELTRLEDERKGVTINNEFDRVYTENGASSMNAQTFYDWTRFFITVPSNKLELWCWMESDRLGDPVFREFDAEKDVVVEERRTRMENSPTGELDEQFESMMWMASPYNWPVIGWPSDLQAYTLEDTTDYFRTHYQPSNLVGVIVGDFDPANAKQMVTEYFGQLRDYGTKPPPVATTEIKRLGRYVFTGECDCQPQAGIVFQGVPVGHADEAALDVAASILNGRTGRLYKSMIEGAEIASSAEAFNWTLKYAGIFAVQGEVKGDATPEMLYEMFEQEIALLRDEPVSDRELQKVKNNSAADAFREMQSNMGLLQRLLAAEAVGSWHDINEYPKRIAGVTVEDIQRVANAYFDVKTEAVGMYYRRASEGGETGELTLDDVLADVPEEQRAMIKPMLQQGLDQLAKTTVEDLAELKASIPEMEGQLGMVPPFMKSGMEFMLNKVKARIAELEGVGGENDNTDGEG